MNKPEGRKKGNKGNLVLVLIIILILVIPLLLFYIVLPFFIFGDYERDIQRITDDENEAHILDIVENFSYGDVFNEERYVDDDWANYIDSEVINHYNREYETLRNQGARHDVRFKYKAQIQLIEELEIVYDRISRNTLTGINGSIDIFTINSDDLPDTLATYDGTDYHIEDSITNFEMNYTDVYLATLYLEYSDTWGFLAGFNVEINQIVILDQGLQPLFIYISLGQWIT